MAKNRSLKFAEAAPQPLDKTCFTQTAQPSPALAPDGKQPPPQSPQEACRRAVAAIVSASPKIIQAQIEKASEGSYLHARLLFEFAGLSGALGSPAAEQDHSLARLLLQQLQIEDEAIENEAKGAAGEQTPLG